MAEGAGESVNRRKSATRLRGVAACLVEQEPCAPLAGACATRASRVVVRASYVRRTPHAPALASARKRGSARDALLVSRALTGGARRCPGSSLLYGILPVTAAHAPFWRTNCFVTLMRLLGETTKRISSGVGRPSA